MRYFFNEKIENVWQITEDRFVVEIFDEQGRNNKDRYYLMDRLGRIIDKPFELVDDYGMELFRQDGFFEVKRKGVTMLVDKFADEFIRDFEYASEFTDDEISTVKWKSGKCELITRLGEIFSDEYSDYGAFENGLCPVKIDENKYGYIDANKVLQPAIFDGITASFNNPQYSYFENNQGCFVINRNLEILSGPYDKILFIDECNNVWVNKGINFSLYTPTGECLVKDAIINYQKKDTYLVTKNNERYFIDKNGKRISNLTFDYAEPFRCGYAPAYKGYDKNGEPIYTVLKRNGSTFRNKYGQAIVLGDNLLALYVNGESDRTGKYFLFDGNERRLGTRGYKRPFMAGENLFGFQVNNEKYTYVRNNNLKRFKENFDSISIFKFGYAEIKNDEKIDLINPDEIKISDISQVVKAVDENPYLFANLPNEIVESKRLYFDIYSYIIEKLKDFQGDEKEKLLKLITEVYEKNKNKSQGQFGE